MDQDESEEKKQKNGFKPQEIEKKWQEKWESDRTFSPDILNAREPYFNLMMFPYPSAEGLHVGNMYAFTGADVHGRFRRMQGKDVFEPIGLDGFGIHSENYALKVGKHPAEQAKISQANFYRQLRSTGNAYDWTRTLETYDPEYYKWTQWLFIQMFKQGLAYRKKATVNWCPSDKTVLADEQVIDGKCERDGAVVEKRALEQWFFKITDYADRLLSGLEKIDWPEKIKIAQRNWIGKSEGARLRFVIASPDGAKQSQSTHDLEVFTTRPDTLWGATFMVISPEHALSEGISNNQFQISNEIVEEVKNYINAAKEKSAQDRTDDRREKTGVFSGLYAINPINGEEIPIWIADYVLMGYGTGAIMVVPAHDERDFEFAKKYDLPIKSVIASVAKQSKESEEIALSSATPRNDNNLYIGEGIIKNSGEWDGISVPAEMPKILEDLEKKGIGKREANYHLRDWLISRQRYWGPPIPMIFCKSCEENQKGEREDMLGWWTSPVDKLPVALPDVEDWRPEGDGTSPLANHPEFYEVNCPSCNNPAKRETDVSDTFLDSAWYYLRYLSIGNQLSDSNDVKSDQNESSLPDPDSVPYQPQVIKRWCPVAIYIGGAEHSVLHLLYVRFVAMVLHDLGKIEKGTDPSTSSGSKSNALALDFEEPFPKFFAHGLIVKDGAKMSKSRGNVVVPDRYIEKFGADTLRMYLMFLGQFKDGGDFRDSGIEGMNRFVRRVWKLLSEYSENSDSQKKSENQTIGDSDKSESLNDRSSESSEFSDRLRLMHKTIKGVTEDLETFSYNTAIAKMMEWYNFLSEDITKNQEPITKNEIETFLKLLAPFAPHMTEELFQKASNVSEVSEVSKANSIHFSNWPTYDEKYLVQDEIIVPIQVNGKRRGELKVKSEKLEVKSWIEEQAKEVIKTHLEGSEVKKVIYVPGKIINFVI